jgi:hypothetical protein
MARSPLDVAKDAMSGKATARRVAAAERAAAPAAAPTAKRKPKVSYKPKKKFVDARQREIAAAAARDRAAIIARNKQQSLRSQ